MKLEDSDKPYNFSRNLVFSCQYHVIFTPKYRRKVLSEPIQKRLKELILEKQEGLGYKVLEMEIMLDHVHLLLDSDPQKGIYQQINGIKGYTSKILRQEFPELKKRIPCLWTRSKFISSVGAVTLEVVKQYIENQKNV